ncbi:hypothetical protein EKO29_16580 [Colwellia sp. Arc7-635]|uniref:BFO_1060 family glycosyltransferase n=1 Tax=Colwellia sp. Arc7-635 TaxID=2497879 RepID=UPI000F859F52|nr:hypothetical protein [Colwellia sp. Arc7-635]AZQ85459.1 hypothetical protein EKO29_16580 [Colwellia sp. Arc7-635]
MKNIDVLNLEWPNNERDTHAVAPIILELRKRNKICITGDIFSYVFYLAKFRPKILLIASFQGALINHNLCKLAHKLGIKVISLIAEGNTRETAVKQMTWGNNIEKLIYFEKMLLWSYRSETLIHKNFPELESNTAVVGGVGFDRYKRLNFLKKAEFLKKIKHNPNIKQVIGLAGWGFDRVHDTEFYFKNKKSILANFQEGQREMHRKDFVLLQTYMKEVVTKNPQILFVLRPHPGLTDYYYDEFKELKSLANVYYSQPRSCPFSISDLIAVSDLWGGYETTTCLEAWLLGKETFLINPSGGDFNRDITAKGSYIISDIKLLHDVLNNSKSIKDFFSDTIEIINKRKEIISDVIGFDDGKNYLRATEEIEPILNDLQYPQFTIFRVLKLIGIVPSIKSIFRNINSLNKSRGLRLVDQSQIERAISKYNDAL